MSTIDIKDVIIDIIKSMKKKDAEIFYGQLVEEENCSDKDFFEHWKDIPAEHKVSIENGLLELEKGKKKNFNSFAKSFAKKTALKNDQESNHFITC